ncbi:MAG: hypothetical protein Kow0010_14270 [Dehalococcoidia bacterium]
MGLVTHELAQMLQATPKTLAHLVVEVPEERFDAAEPGGWSPRLVLAHLRDIEVLSLRLGLERLLAEDEPRLARFDTEAWETSRNLDRDRKDVLLTDFALQRRASAALIEALGPADWQRTGIAPDGAPVSVEGWVRAWLRHDAEHIAQLEALVGETLAEVLARRAQMRG